ncbi:MAG: threonine synthase, partial [Candidatus Nanohaloarchaea archaeon]
PADEMRYRCERCGDALEAAYDYGEIRDRVSWSRLRQRPFRHARYREFLPDTGSGRVEMGVGGTPIVESRVLGDELGIDLRFKMESLNPTGSFKDRGTAVELGVALAHGAEEVAVASTGNMGASVAAYAARAGIDATIYIPASTTGPKRTQMERHGADIVAVDGDFDDAADRAWQAWTEDGVHLLGDYAYRVEGEKTAGFEVADQVDADVVAAPVGNGTFIHAVWKSFTELQEVGMLDDLPRMAGVQAAGCNTVVDALRKGTDDVAAVKADTVAGAIACGDPLDGAGAVHALRASDGLGEAVTDDEILAAKRVLAEREGIYAEPAGATAFAGIRERADDLQGETVVCFVTGHGLKT